MCIKPTTTEAKINSNQHRLVQKQNKNIHRMPKKPYQRDNNNDRNDEKVICKNVGNNGMCFVLQDDHDSSNIREIKQEEPAKVARGPIRSKAKGSDMNPGTAAFVTILLHALKCSNNCDQVSCKKMIMVLKHYQSCRNKRLSLAKASNGDEGPNQQQTACKLCQQLLRIVAHHSKYLCQLPPDQQGCPVLMCDTFRIMSCANPSGSGKIRRVNGAATQPV